MHPTVKSARIAGVLYLLGAATAPFPLLYLPSKLIVQGDAAATANNVLGSQMLFRLGIVAELVTAVFFILLVIALYHLLSEVNKNLARVMVGLVLVSVAVTFADVVSNIAALTLFRGADFLAALDKPQRDVLGTLFLDLHTQGIVVNQILWGLWLLPFGVLVMRSRFIPRILGILVVINGLALVAGSLTSLLFPTYEDVVSRAILPAVLGEFWIMLWLLIKGAKVPPLNAAAS